eukprot:scaffold237550_cov36-Tisochrysis_lutea.AAC.2
MADGVASGILESLAELRRSAKDGACVEAVGIQVQQWSHRLSSLRLRSRAMIDDRSRAPEWMSNSCSRAAVGRTGYCTRRVGGEQVKAGRRVGVAQ